MLFRFTLVAAALLVSACSDPKAANEKNFKTAIQKAMDAEYPTCYVKSNFPATIGGFDVSGNKRNFKALVSAGLLSEKEEPHMTTEYLRNRVEVQPTYYLTDEGKKYYKAGVAKTVLGETVGGFCFGKGVVKDITEFTEPADMGGVKASRVSFTYQVSDIPAWATSPEILAAMPRLKADVESEKTPIKGGDVLALTNNGWVSQLAGMQGMFGR
jgi:hypothetical protein